MTTGDPHNNRSTTTSNVLQWLGSLALAAVIVLPTALNRHHYASHKASSHVIAPIIVGLGLALVFRAICFAVVWVARRSRTQPPPSDARPVT